jgi:ABC-type glutathione transport system ATPase component
VEIQLIFQQPASSLNPRFTAAEIVEEPLLIARRGSAAERRELAARALELTGIARATMGKRAHEFSGGERQRLAIARAMVVEPKVLILDESFNGLDPDTQQRVASLLKELQARLGIACIVVSHDLGMIAGFAGEIGVLERGVLIEYGPAGKVIGQPRHAHTRELIAAARVLHPKAFPV